MFDATEYEEKLKQCPVDELIGIISTAIQILEEKKPQYNWRDWN